MILCKILKPAQKNRFFGEIFNALFPGFRAPGVVHTVCKYQNARKKEHAKRALRVELR